MITYYQAEFILFLLSTVTTTTALQSRRQSSSNLRAKGPPHVNIVVKTAKTSANGALQTSEPLTIWCQIVANKSPYEAVPAKRMYFEQKHKGKKHDATLDSSRTNGSLTINALHVYDAGPWICHGETQFGETITGRIFVYLRPVIIGNTRIDEIEGPKKHNFKGSGISVRESKDALLECPIEGYPKPVIVWKKGVQEISGNKAHLVSENALKISNATEKDHGIYTCEATNTIPQGKGRQMQTTFLDRELRVKNPYSWGFPCGVIVLTVIILAAIIYLYERKGSKEDRQRRLLSPSAEDN